MFTELGGIVELEKDLLVFFIGEHDENMRSAEPGEGFAADWLAQQNGNRTGTGENGTGGRSNGTWNRGAGGIGGAAGARIRAAGGDEDEDDDDSAKNSDDESGTSADDDKTEPPDTTSASSFGEILLENLGSWRALNDGDETGRGGKWIPTSVLEMGAAARPAKKKCKDEEPTETNVSMPYNEGDGVSRARNVGVVKISKEVLDEIFFKAQQEGYKSPEWMSTADLTRLIQPLRGVTQGGGRPSSDNPGVM